MACNSKGLHFSLFYLLFNILTFLAVEKLGWHLKSLREPTARNLNGYLHFNS
ncbi:hypothetical protein DB42_BQ00030 [Neochlamydia sp. EPS4]|nr:hypothetical protein DB42_BQ00030 [Neochlamydia sp. EPS4]